MDKETRSTIEFVETERGHFAIHAAGPASGKPIVLQHGFPDDPTTFAALQGDLAAAGYRSVAPYLRGYDPSPLEGPCDSASLALDLLAIVDSISPEAPVSFVGHDFGTQAGYKACADKPKRFRRAVMLAVAHPAIVSQNIKHVPRQIWLSRYILGFQLKGLAEWRMRRRNFALVDKLWRRWSPGLTLPRRHLRHVKDTMRRSMPAPIAMYRSGAWGIPEKKIKVPTLLIVGRDDGCGDIRISEGQERLFRAEYRREILEDAGHFVHLDQPRRVSELVLDWLGRA